MDESLQRFSGILLAGGSSSRMGQDKAFLKFRGAFLYEFNLRILEKFSNDIIISSSNHRFDSLGYLRISDEVPTAGPMGGIYTCLKHIRYDKAIVLACDMPFVSPEIISSLIEVSTSAEVVVPLNFLNKPEPLTAIYSTGIIPVLSDMIQKGNYKMQELLKKVNSKLMYPVGINENTFRNINTESDFRDLEHKG
jgi:molybdopterin-guanine dinucleotide biosynthesis protein A